MTRGLILTQVPRSGSCRQGSLTPQGQGLTSRPGLWGPREAAHGCPRLPSASVLLALSPCFLTGLQPLSSAFVSILASRIFRASEPLPLLPSRPTSSPFPYSMSLFLPFTRVFFPRGILAPSHLLNPGQPA